MAPTKPNRDRTAALADALDTAFGPASDSIPMEIVRAPGSVNLIGDHTEDKEGLVLPVAIELDTWIAFRRRRDGLVRVVSRQSREPGQFRIDGLEPGTPGGVAAPGPAGVSTPGAGGAPGGPVAGARWSEYVAATAWSLREAGLPVRGFDGVVDTTI